MSSLTEMPFRARLSPVVVGGACCQVEALTCWGWRRPHLPAIHGLYSNVVALMAKLPIIFPHGDDEKWIHIWWNSICTVSGIITRLITITNHEIKYYGMHTMQGAPRSVSQFCTNVCLCACVRRGVFCQCAQCFHPNFSPKLQNSGWVAWMR